MKHKRLYLTKEDILKELKGLVLTLRYEPDKLKKDMVFISSWKSKHQDISIEIKNLNSNDTKWLDDEYKKWFKSEILPNLPEIDPTIKDKLLKFNP